MSASRPAHVPVMAARVVELLATPGPGVLVDATVGAGGHAAALLGASGGQVHLIGFDRDPEALALARDRLAPYGDRVHLVHAPFDRLVEQASPVVAAAGPVLGVLYDLGVSSMQLDTAQRGFSFRAEAPLDMRMDPTRPGTAADLLDRLDTDTLARLLRELGDERYARRIAAAIVAARPVRTTGRLADIVVSAVPAAARRERIHPATRTFQALRIAVNGELDRFSASLPQALELLAPPAPARAVSPAGACEQARGGRIAVLTYHSGEDRIAKHVLADAATGCICPPQMPVCGCGRTALVRLLIRGVARPEAAEIAHNPRARPAKLRAAERTAPDRSSPLP